ncbi:hypothetical protein [Hymenobacter negativus]|nr:hypothetical protein [Hymenobacter negativus]
MLHSFANNGRDQGNNIHYGANGSYGLRHTMATAAFGARCVG